MNLVEKILKPHLLSGDMRPGEPLALRVEQTLTQDALGMLAYLAFESLGLPAVRTELSVSYLDHNLLYADYRNPDDHAYLMSVARRYGITVSRAGNGICHSVHLARFAQPGKLVVGTDSHTPSAGALGMIGIGAGGLDVAAVMAGEPLMLAMPRIVKIELTGRLRPGVNAKDAALCILRAFGVKGGLGCAFEFGGEGLKTLSVPERMTLTNLAVETGATTSVCPTDGEALRFLRFQGREADFIALAPDPNAVYDDVFPLDLGAVEPMVALPHRPDNVVTVREAAGTAVDQVFIGSCTNSSYSDLMKAAAILRGRRIAENVSLLGRNLLMSEQLNSWYELKQRVNWLKAEMQRGRRLVMQADQVDDAELLAMLENRLEQEPKLLTPDFGAAELAELMGVSQARLIRLFRNATIFKSPDEYIENLRLMRALQLLRDHSQYGIAAVSAEAGYNSVRTLQRRMSDIIGMTPVEFRMMVEK